ncbi:MAG: zinc ribbon domain-containing protein [Thiohalomonadaceae bacterium]
MPIYEYACKSCGHTLEAMQKTSDAPLKSCPACNKPKLEKLISAAGFRLKGGGWYETDFKTGAKKNISESPSAPAHSCGGGGCGCAATK